MRLLPGSNQEHLCRVSPERTAVGGLLLWLRTVDRDREQLPRGIHGFKGDSVSLSRIEVGMLEGFSCHLFQGGASEPADRICGPVEVPPAGVGLHTTRHPRHRDGLPGGRVRSAGQFPAGPLSGVHITYSREGNHYYASKIGQYHPSRPNSVRGGELDGV